MLRSLAPVLAPALALLSLEAGSAAQLARAGVPASAVHELEGGVPAVVLPRPDLERYRAEDEASAAEIGPFRYGAVIEHSIGLDEDGLWNQVDESGALVWRTEITSPGALSLGVLFGEFELPKGGELYLYTPDGRQVLGAFTHENEQSNGMLAIQPVRGDRVVLEYVQPAWVSGSPRLRVESVVHDYKGVFTGFEGPEPDSAASCLIDINCAAGQPYQDIKRAVIGLFRGGFVCTGSIINNTAQDGTPYMLTAEHCGDFTNGTFVFNYERTGCGGGSFNLDDSLSGAQLLAKDAYIDGQLYRLNETPPQSFNPFYAGWGRGSAPPAPAVGISHPAGLPKKISLDTAGVFDLGNMWGVNWTSGEIQGGSSGSPIFAGNMRVIGQLCCGSGSCGGQTVSYGQLRDFYRRRSLERWLDPLNLGAIWVDGLDPFLAASIVYNGSGANATVYASQTPPALGTTWTATVDTSGHPGAVSTLIQGHVSPSAGTFFSWGELLIDLSSTRIFRAQAGIVGNVSTYLAPIPNDPGLSGAVAFSQAFILGGGLEGTNGLELRVF